MATAASVYATWNGQAAASYQALSAAVAAHFWHAAGVSRTAAAALHRYATELMRLQLEGTQALHQAEHWLSEVNTWTARLRTATNDVTKAQAAVQAAQNALNHATAAPHGTAYRAAAGRVCHRYRTEVAGLPRPRSAAEFTGYVEHVRALTLARIDQLRALRVPGALAADERQMDRYVARVIAAVTRLAARLRGGESPRRATAAFRRAVAGLTPPVDRLWKSLGVPACVT